MGLFSHHGSSNHTCPMPTSFAKEAAEPIVGNLSFYHLNMIISGVCTAIACLVALLLTAAHAMHLSKPREQLKIMKICFLIPLYSLTSFLCICFPEEYVYLAPWLDFYQAMALGTFLLLLCEFLASKDSQWDVVFASLRVSGTDDKLPVVDINSFRKQWIAVFQYPVVALLVAIVTDITQAAGIYCLDSRAPYFAHIWITVIRYISLVVAVMAALNFYRIRKADLVGHQALAKLLAFKLIVGISFLESLLFTILRSTNTLKESSTLSYADVNIGISNMVICIQMVLFALFFPFAYRVKPYLISRTTTPGTTGEGAQDLTYHQIQQTKYQGGTLGLRAWIVFLNPLEILQAIVFAFTMATASRGGFDDEEDHMGSRRRRHGNRYGY